jgi:type II secretory pathway predicted ATPase ExeA
MAKDKDESWKLPDKLPFGKDIVGDELFKFDQLAELRTTVRLAIEQRTIGAVSGQAGTGKTCAVRSVTDDLPTNKYQVLYVGQEHDETNLCRRIAAGLGLAAKRFKNHAWMQVSQHLCENLAEQGKQVVAVFDEAHLLSGATLENLRLLMNADFDRASPLSIILIGQLPLRAMLKAPGFEALNQRIRFRYSLDGFTEEETTGYIQHHLRLAGLPDDIFSKDATKAIFLAAKGILREINNVALLALLKAESTGMAKVDGKLIRQVLEQRELS